MLMALITAMVAAHWSPDRAWRVLIDVRNAGGDPLRTDRHGKPQRKPRLYFEKAWSGAEEYLTTHPPIRDRAGAVERLVAMREAATGARWSGRGGATDRAVLDILISMAMRAGRLHIHASVRDVAVGVGCNPVTASRSLKRLEATRWIARVSNATPTLAAQFKLKMPRGGTLPQHSGFREPENYASDELIETFCWAGLGWSKHRVYAALGSEPISASDLAAALGVTPRTVARHLRRLASHGLAIRVLDGWTRGATDLLEVAVWLGTAGRRERQREQHIRERAGRRAARARLHVDPETGEIRDTTATLRFPYGPHEQSVALTSLRPREGSVHG